MAHTLIADLFGAGLRLQQLAAGAPPEMREDLDQVAGQLDRVIAELRSFAFTTRS